MIEIVQTIKPFYARRGAILLCGNGLKIMNSLKRESVHMVLVDPPYNIGYCNRQNEKIIGDDGTFPTREAMELALRLLIPTRRVLTFYPNATDFSPLLLGLPFSKLHQMMWDKMSPGYGPSEIGSQFETMLYFVYRETKLSRATKPLAPIRRGDIFSYRRVPHGKRIHPAEKPVMLLQELIERSTKPGEIVLDYCAGSGATMEAAIRRDRRAIGIEISRDYCEKIAERLDRVIDRMEPSDTEDDLAPRRTNNVILLPQTRIEKKPEFGDMPCKCSNCLATGVK